MTQLRGLAARLRPGPAFVVMLGLTVLSFLQLPGRTTFDTKLDLSVDPIAFLARTLHLWNPEASGGELQNQAYGYLFPMGPYFAATHAVGIPPWIAQRLWCALLLCLAFGGTLLVARALKIGSEPARFAGAIGYALAPRMLTEIGPLSAEMLPAALLPWVLLPLLRADRIGSPRRAACLSALAVLCMGGINGAMVVMALVLPVLWLLTRRWTRAHLRLALWWCAGVAAATLWWILPLLVLGQYSVPFVDYVESAANTTAPTSLFQVLRGTNQWVAYVFEGSAWWPAGFMLVDHPALMLATGLVAAIGLFGLVRAGLPERRFLVLGVVLSVALLTIGYVGTLDSPISEYVRGLLDGPLAPLRNVHKFEPGLRLALMLGFTHAVSGPLPAALRRRSAVGGDAGSALRRRSAARPAVGMLLVAVMAAPAWLGTLRPGPGWPDVPEYWRQTMDWLGEHSSGKAGDRTLMVPGTGFGEYTWGKTVDEPAQALASSPWALRSQIPLGSEGYTRLMDAVENELANGRGSTGLADLLARSGHGYLLVRNDIDRKATAAPPSTLVHAALARSPGLERVAGFGPEVRPDDQPLVSPVDAAAGAARAVEIYRVRVPVQGPTAVPSQDVATVSGGPESLLQLLSSGLLRRDHPAMMAGDSAALPSEQWLVTDGLRRQERNVGRVRDNLSQTLTVDEVARQDRPTLDVVPFEGMRHQTIAAYRGVRSVSASSAASYADEPRRSEPSSMPFAAVDGDPATAWHSSELGLPQDQWLEVELDTPRVLEHVTLKMVDDWRVGWPVTEVRITTDAGTVTRAVTGGGKKQRFAVAKGLTGRVRVEIAGIAADRTTGSVGIADLGIPGLAAQRALRVPGDAKPREEQAMSFSFTRGPRPRYPCVRGTGGIRCDAGLTRFGEEPHGIHRLFRSTAGADYTFGGTVLPVPGARLPLGADGVEVSASTVLAGDPAAGALSALDNDSGTTWISDVTDKRPTLRLRWFGGRKLSSIRVTTDQDSGAARPAELDIRTPFARRTVRLDSSGRAKLDLETDQLEIIVTQVAEADGRTRKPAGISEIAVPEVTDAAIPLTPQAQFVVPCGSGPNLHIDGFDYATTVSGTLADIQQHRPLTLGSCRDAKGGIRLSPGEHELRADTAEAFLVQDLWLRPEGTAAGRVSRRAVDVRSWAADRRTLHVGAGDAAVLAVPENANDGWVATADGRRLTATRVDGWQQAWLLPEGEAVDVTLEFVADSDYRRGLLIGAAAAGLLVLTLLIPVRRRVTVDTTPSEGHVLPAVLIATMVVVGGMPAVVAVLACLLARALWPPAPRWLVLAGALLAGGTAVAGRLFGQGQEWAYGPLAQGSLIVVLAAVVAVSVDWFQRPPEPEEPESSQ